MIMSNDTFSGEDATLSVQNFKQDLAILVEMYKSTRSNVTTLRRN
jgi:hypothetical protein